MASPHRAEDPGLPHPLEGASALGDAALPQGSTGSAAPSPPRPPSAPRGSCTSLSWRALEPGAVCRPTGSLRKAAGTTVQQHPALGAADCGAGPAHLRRLSRSLGPQPLSLASSLSLRHPGPKSSEGHCSPGDSCRRQGPGWGLWRKTPWGLPGSSSWSPALPPPEPCGLDGSQHRQEELHCYHSHRCHQVSPHGRDQSAAASCEITSPTTTMSVSSKLVTSDDRS